MILVTVGSQAPFDRLISSVDRWAQSTGRSDVFAQIANGAYRPSYIRFTDFVPPQELKNLCAEAQVIVSHAGMGTIITALELGKPIVVLPRRECFRETRNDHQVAAAKYFGEQGRIVVAEDEHQIAEKIDLALTQRSSTRISSKASPRLLATIEAFLHTNSREHALVAVAEQKIH